MNAADTRVVLGDLAAAFPYFTVSAEVVTVWSDHLEPIAADVATKAVWMWTETQDRPPSVAQFLQACRDELRSRRTELAEESTGPDRQTPLGKGFVAALRAALQAKAAGTDPVAAFEEARPRGVAEREETFVCWRCEDRGLIEVDERGHGTYRPCEDCRGSEHARWRAGRYELVRRLA